MAKVERYEKKVKQIAVAPDGTVFDRTSDRVYRYVVVVRVGESKKRPTHWGYLQWTSRMDLAQKYMAQAESLINHDWKNGDGAWRELRIVPVEVATKE